MDRQTDPSWSCTLAQPLGTARAALLSGAHPGPQPNLGDSLPFLPPSTSTPRCSSPCSATNSQNHSCSYKPSGVSWSPSSCDSSTFPCCPAAVCFYFTLPSLHWGRRLRVSHGFPESCSSHFCLAGFKTGLSPCTSSPQPAKESNKLPGLHSLPHCPEPLHHCHHVMLNQAPAD